MSGFDQVIALLRGRQLDGLNHLYLEGFNDGLHGRANSGFVGLVNTLPTLSVPAGGRDT